MAGLYFPSNGVPVRVPAVTEVPAPPLAAPDPAAVQQFSQWSGQTPPAPSKVAEAGGVAGAVPGAVPFDVAAFSPVESGRAGLMGQAGLTGHSEDSTLSLGERVLNGITRMTHAALPHLDAAPAPDSARPSESATASDPLMQPQPQPPLPLSAAGLFELQRTVVEFTVSTEIVSSVVGHITKTTNQLVDMH